MDSTPRLRCAERYCDRLPTHYVQEYIECEPIAGPALRVESLRVPYCAEHAPSDAKPIPDDWTF